MCADRLGLCVGACMRAQVGRWVFFHSAEAISIRLGRMRSAASASQPQALAAGRGIAQIAPNSIQWFKDPAAGHMDISWARTPLAPDIRGCGVSGDVAATGARPGDDWQKHT